MNKNMRIRKVKITKEKRFLLMYEQKSKNGWQWDEYSMVCSEEPRPGFHQVLRDLRTHVLDMCELPENYLDKISVRGVSLVTAARMTRWGRRSARLWNWIIPISSLI